MKPRLAAAGLGLALATATTGSIAMADNPPVGAEAEAQVWQADFDKAVELAKKEKKDLLVDFTGSDWCGWCIKLHKEVFAHDDFVAAARKNFVLVALDFPRSDEAKAKVPNQKRNDELRDKYAIHGYPTVLLMTSDGDVFGQTGYQEGGSGKYVEHIAKIRDEGLPELKTSRDLTAAINSAKAEEKPALADKAIAALAELPEDSPKAVLRVGPVKAAFASDPENKAGVGSKAALALMKAGAADATILAAAEKMDPKNEKGLLEQTIGARQLRSLDDVKAYVKSCDELFAAGVKDKKLAKQLALNCAGMNFQHLRDLDKAKAYAKKVQDMGFEADEDRLKDFIKKILDAKELPPERK